MEEQKVALTDSLELGLLEQTIGTARELYANPKLDALVYQAVALAAQGKDTLEIESQITAQKPRREWFLLWGYKGFRAMAKLYDGLKEPGLKRPQYAEAMARAKAIGGGRKIEDTPTSLFPPLGAELHNAIENLAFSKKQF